MTWLKSKSGSGTYSAGISGITSNYEASQRHISTAHVKGEFVEARWNMVDRTGSNAERQQRDLRPHEISRSEDQVKRTVEAFQSFANPFHLEIYQPDLRQVASPRTASRHLRSDYLFPHSDAIFNGDDRWVPCENQQSARDELPDQKCGQRLRTAAKY